MATGANAKYWEDSRLPGVLKLKLLERYLPIFLIRTSMPDKHVAYIDGFAGRGKYENGQLGSPGLMMKFAVGQKFQRQTAVDLFLCERDKESYEDLEALAASYRAKGVAIEVTNGDATKHLGATLPRVAKLPTFIFEDPTGLGVPYANLVEAMNRNNGAGWPPTEMMINLSLEGIRRIGGHLTSAVGNKTTIQRLDETIGGEWWRDLLGGGVTASSVEAVVAEFTRRLAADTGSEVIAVPVLRAPRHQPVYYLVFCTRHRRGVWNFGHCAAMATNDWWQAADAVADERLEAEAGDQIALLPVGPEMRHPTIDEVEEKARPHVAGNIEALLQRHGRAITLGDHAREVFGDYYGQVRDSVARAAVKDLHGRGLTPSDGKHGKVENLIVVPGVFTL